jgi:iron complex outermembrane recepter protein
MNTNLRFKRLAWLLCSVASRAAMADTQLAEHDYFSELPQVLTVTRLAQPISDTPGAVTIIDRETIRRSGAREVADLLRLVPGYLVAGKTGANPTAAYHAPLDDFGIRNLVMIDGRSVYSSSYFGGTFRGLMGLLLEDIERIEVLRGSNSAAYGANALFGTINIVTRNTADTHGAEVSVTSGEGGINDKYARIGWGNEVANFRLSAGQRKDSGYGNLYDDKALSQLHFRGDLRLSGDQELMIAAGMTDLASGDGFLGRAGNPERTIDWRTAYLQGQWTRQLSETDSLKLTASFDEERFGDDFPYLYDPSVIISFNTRGRRANLELQHQLGISTELRVVWGGGYKYEDVNSAPLYATNENISIHEVRLFGSLEWRLHPQWLINAGGFYGHHSWTGDYFSPRLMANFQATPDHTFRAGISESTRTPTLFELASDVRYYPKNALNTPLAFPLPGKPDAQDFMPYLAAMKQPFRTYASSGTVQPEKLYTEEIGYFGNFRELRMTLDVRIYMEHMKDLIVEDDIRVIPGYLSGVVPSGTMTQLGPLPFNFPISTPVKLEDFFNSSGFSIHGLEYQLRWKPLEDTEIWLNQAFEDTHWEDKKTESVAPTHATTIAWFQKLPYDFDLGVIYQTMGPMNWHEAADALPSRRRTDVRLAKPFRIGSTRAEAALVVQAANGTYPEYQTDHGVTQTTFERRAFGTLRIEF